jgi:DNA-binding MarR family transcriptional regulator
VEPANPGYLVWRLSMKWRAAVDREVAPWGLTHAQYSLLASLYGVSRDGVAPSQRELADVTGLDAIYVSKLVRALEQGGLLTRAPHDRDPRAWQLSLTPHGIQTITSAIDAVRVLQARLTRTLGGPRSKRTKDLTDALRALLDDPEGELS